MEIEGDQGSGFTAEEAAVYDRQIRVWGMDAQKRMRNSNVLVFGINGLGAEVCKTLVLAGIGSITIMDDAAVQMKDLGANFFITEADVGKNVSGTSFFFSFFLALLPLI